MPPKQSAANGDASEGSGKFVWEGPNDNKLLLLTQGRYVKPEEYEQLSKALGTNTGSIRNRIFALRVKQRNMYVKLGWGVPEGGAGHSTKKVSKKRVTDNSDKAETLSKKPRAKKAKKESSDDSAGKKESAQRKGVKVKDEELDDEIETEI